MQYSTPFSAEDEKISLKIYILSIEIGKFHVKLIVFVKILDSNSTRSFFLKVMLWTAIMFVHDYVCFYLRNFRAAPHNIT